MKVTIDITPEAAKSMVDSYRARESVLRKELRQVRSSRKSLQCIVSSRGGPIKCGPKGKRSSPGENERVFMEYMEKHPEKLDQYKAGTVSQRDISKACGVTGSAVSVMIRKLV